MSRFSDSSSSSLGRPVPLLEQKYGGPLVAGDPESESSSSSPLESVDYKDLRRGVRAPFSDVAASDASSLRMNTSMVEEVEHSEIMHFQPSKSRSSAAVVWDPSATALREPESAVPSSVVSSVTPPSEVTITVDRSHRSRGFRHSAHSSSSSLSESGDRKRRRKSTSLTLSPREIMKPTSATARRLGGSQFDLSTSDFDEKRQTTTNDEDERSLAEEMNDERKEQEESADHSQGRAMVTPPLKTSKSARRIPSRIQTSSNRSQASEPRYHRRHSGSSAARRTLHTPPVISSRLSMKKLRDQLAPLSAHGTDKEDVSLLHSKKRKNRRTERRHRSRTPKMSSDGASRRRGSSSLSVHHSPVVSSALPGTTSDSRRIDDRRGRDDFDGQYFDDGMHHIQPSHSSEFRPRRKLFSKSSELQSSDYKGNSSRGSGSSSMSSAERTPPLPKELGMKSKERRAQSSTSFLSANSKASPSSTMASRHFDSLLPLPLGGSARQSQPTEHSSHESGRSVSRIRRRNSKTMADRGRGGIIATEKKKTKPTLTDDDDDGHLRSQQTDIKEPEYSQSSLVSVFEPLQRARPLSTAAGVSSTVSDSYSPMQSVQITRSSLSDAARIPPPFLEAPLPVITAESPLPRAVEAALAGEDRVKNGAKATRNNGQSRRRHRSVDVRGSSGLKSARNSRNHAVVVAHEQTPPPPPPPLVYPDPAAPSQSRSKSSSRSTTTIEVPLRRQSADFGSSRHRSYPKRNDSKQRVNVKSGVVVQVAKDTPIPIRVNRPPFVTTAATMYDSDTSCDTPTDSGSDTLIEAAEDANVGHCSSKSLKIGLTSAESSNRNDDASLHSMTAHQQFEHLCDHSCSFCCQCCRSNPIIRGFYEDVYIPMRDEIVGLCDTTVLKLLFNVILGATFIFLGFVLISEAINFHWRARIAKLNTWTFQLANALLVVSYASPEILILRLVLLLAGLFFVVWSLTFQSGILLDTCVWNIILVLINLRYAVAIFYSKRPIIFSADTKENEIFEQIYQRIFIGCLSRDKFLILIGPALIRTKKSQRYYAEKGDSVKNLSILVKGRIQVLKSRYQRKRGDYRHGLLAAGSSARQSGYLRSRRSRNPQNRRKKNSRRMGALPEFSHSSGAASSHRTISSLDGRTHHQIVVGGGNGPSSAAIIAEHESMDDWANQGPQMGHLLSTNSSASHGNGNAIVSGNRRLSEPIVYQSGPGPPKGHPSITASVGTVAGGSYLGTHADDASSTAVIGRVDPGYPPSMMLIEEEDLKPRNIVYFNLGKRVVIPDQGFHSDDTGAAMSSVATTAVAAADHHHSHHNPHPNRARQSGRKRLFIEPFQFIDSPEWLMKNRHFDVSMKVKERCVYLTWPKEALDKVLEDNPDLKAPLTSVLGYDVSLKLLATNKAH